MLRFLVVVMLAGASAAHAGESYREVWNPPEARHVLHAHYKAHHEPSARRLSAKRSTKMKPSRVTASAPKSNKREHAGRAARTHAGPRVQKLSPRLKLKGHALRVDSNGTRPMVVH